MVESNDVAAAPSLKGNVVYAMSGRVVFALTQFGILSVAAHLGTPEDVGALTLASAIVTPLFFLTSMGMREAHAVDDLSRFTRPDYVSLRIAGGLVAVLLSVAIVMIYRSPAGWQVQSAAIAFALVKFFGAQSSLNHGIFQRAERLDYVALSNVCRGGSGLLFFAAAFALTRDLALSLMFEAAASFLTWLLLDRALLARLDARTAMADLRLVRVRTVAALAWWVLPVGVSLWFLRASVSAPPLVLERHADLATVGIFGALAYVHTALSMLSGAMGSASSARLRRYYRDGRRARFTDLVIKLCLLSAALGAVGVAVAWLAGGAILGVLFGEAYRQRELFTVIVAASSVSIAAGPMVTALTAAQAFRRRLANSATIFAVAVAAALLLIPTHGAFGAAWALAAMTTAHLAVTALSFRRILARMPAEGGGG